MIGPGLTRPTTTMATSILSLDFRKVEATDKAPAYLATELRVDGELVGEKYPVDLRQLAKALTSDGEHFIFTCGCGDSFCAGIYEGFRSWIEGDLVTIEGNLPKGVACSWKLSATQARSAVADALRAIEPVAAGMIDPDLGYPIGPDGFNAAALRKALAALA